MLKNLKNKMSLVALVAALFISAAVHAFDVNIAVSTVDAKGATNGANAFTAAGYPNITGTVNIRQIVSTNYGLPQTISIYDTCTSSTAAVLAMKVVLPSTSTNFGNELLPRVLRLTSPCVTRGNEDGGGSANVTILYE